MTQKQTDDALIEQLEDLLRICKQGGQYDGFAAIHTLTIHWLAGNRIARNNILDHLHVQVEQLAHIVNYVFSEPPRGRLKTWSMVAAALVEQYKGLKECYLECLDTDPKLCGERLLTALSDQAQSYADTLSSSKSEVLNALDALLYKSRKPRAYQQNVFSRKPFSAGLRDSLNRLNSEITYLTVAQVEALEQSFVARKLWVQGPAGSGKTILAVERAYRALRAGMRTLIVFRSTQFHYIFNQLLEPVSEQLDLLPHHDFMELLWQVELHGTASEEFKFYAKKYLDNKLPDEGQQPLWDLVIVDDCGTYDAHLSFRVQEIEKIATRVILLAAPDQVVSRIMYDFYGEEVPDDSDEEDPDLGSLRNAVGILEQKLQPPEDYQVVSLPANLRNARSIAQYAGKVSTLDIASSVIELGRQITHQSAWDKVGDDILEFTRQGLEVYPCQNIKVIVDPFLWHPEVVGGTPRSLVMEKLTPLAAALMTAATNGSFLNTTMEAYDDLAKVVGDRGLMFIATDGEAVNPVATSALKVSAQSVGVLQTSETLGVGRVDAPKVLLPMALQDPLQCNNAIMIYQAPLVIGLEADMVIYVRNHSDIYSEKQALSAATRERLVQVRREQHFLSFSRARHCLIDIILNDQCPA